ncbi:hypothetical protein LSG25_06745 [Paralcaligenes sp. KSB-10]|uniref:hypothetical protein n=1 Tax=Paralcaligenes sp. KSB-10 TaxID=2901142 RepID=UPI001E4A8F1D|nr:hypothetical protein [Paralcaligenes sp. KSB-10]UHL65573.1 hypothetical protein LSG25_06745 [Paralcaligenes sp. KSB-10]
MKTQRNSSHTNPVTREQAASAILALCRTRGRASAVVALSLFGANHLSNVRDSQYGALVGVCEAAMSA